jgi:hypothetical protein
MVSFRVIMSAEFGQGPRQRALAEQDQPQQALLFGRAGPTFRKAFRFWASGRQRNRFRAARRQHRPKRCAELRVAIMENTGMKIAPSVMGGAAGELLHPLLTPVSGDTRHPEPAAASFFGRRSLHWRSVCLRVTTGAQDVALGIWDRTRDNLGGLGPQRGHWWNSNSAPGRNPACEQRDRGEHYRYSDQSDGIRRQDAEEQTGHQRRCA